MTLLLVHASTRGFVIVMDEQVTIRGVPIGSCSKVRLVPHLGAAILAGGSVALANALDVEGHALRHGDVSDLAERAPGVLRKAWADVEGLLGADGLKWLSVGTSVGSRVWLAGQQADGCFAWWRFQAPDFTPEPANVPDWPDAARVVSPTPADWPEGRIVDKFDTLAEMVDLGIRITVERDDPDLRMRLDGREHNAIGGALWATTILDGPTFVIQRVHVFAEDEPTTGEASRYASESCRRSGGSAR